MKVHGTTVATVGFNDCAIPYTVVNTTTTAVATVGFNDCAVSHTVVNAATNFGSCFTSLLFIDYSRLGRVHSRFYKELEPFLIACARFFYANHVTSHKPTE